MKIIAFINEAVVIREILGHLGEPTSPPRLLPACATGARLRVRSAHRVVDRAKRAIVRRGTARAYSHVKGKFSPSMYHGYV